MMPFRRSTMERDSTMRLIGHGGWCGDTAQVAAALTLVVSDPH
jgi:hypothetical protein